MGFIDIANISVSLSFYQIWTQTVQEQCNSSSVQDALFLTRPSIINTSGLWEEARIPRENPHRRGENTNSTQKSPRAPGGLGARTLHCEATVQPAVFYFSCVSEGNPAERHSLSPEPLHRARAVWGRPASCQPSTSGGIPHLQGTKQMCCTHICITSVMQKRLLEFTLCCNAAKMISIEHLGVINSWINNALGVCLYTL